MKHRLPLGLSLALAGASLTACGAGTVAVTRSDGAVLEGYPAGGDTTHVWVYEPRTQQQLAVARAQITDIDHPGDARIWAGGVLGAFGALMLVPAAILLTDDEDPNGAESLILVGSLTLGIGTLAWAVPLITTGIAEHAASEATLDPSHGPPPEPPTTMYLGPTGVRITF